MGRIDERLDKRRRVALAAGVLVAVGGAVILLARHGLGMASLWATVLGLPFTAIGTIATIVQLVITLRQTPPPAQVPGPGPQAPGPGPQAPEIPVLTDLLMTGVGEDGLPPAVTAVNLYDDLGIQPAIPVKRGAADHYIERDADGDIRQALARSKFVIVKGAPKAGKSRSGIEAVRAAFPEALLVAPWPGKRAMEKIADDDLLNGYSGRVVFWLDDLASFLTPTELDRSYAGKLFRLYPKALIVGTIVGAVLTDRRTTPPGVTSPIPDLVRLASDGEVLIESTPSPGELARARALYPDYVFTDETGVPEQLIAADALERYFKDGANDVGWCLVMAGVDWQRMGAAHPVDVSVLRAMAVHYGDVRRKNLKFGEKQIRDGFEWAEKPVGSSEALLNVVERDPDGRPASYQAFGPLRALVKTPVPLASWKAAATTAGPADSIAVALAALAVGPGLRDTAKSALARASESGDDRHAADWAALLLGDLQTLDGQVTSARGLYDRAVRADDNTVAGLARVDLGALLSNLGEVDEARRLLAEAAASANPTTGPLAKAMLGSLLIPLGELDQSVRLFNEAISSQNPLAVSLAQAMLGSLLMNTGQLDRARQLLVAAIDSGNPLAVPLAQATLGTLLMNAGDLVTARRLLGEAIDSGNPQAVVMAQSSLSGLLMITGQPDQARQVLEDAIKTGNPLVVPLAQTNLAGLLVRTGDAKRAGELLDAAIGSGNLVAATLGQVYRGELLSLTGQPEAAREALESAARSGNPVVVPLAQAMLAGITEDLEEARQLLVAAAASGNPLVTPLAQALLGSRYLESGDLEQARPLLEAAAASNSNAIAMGIAQLSLGDLYQRIDQPELARQSLEAAVGSPYPDVARPARYQRAGLLDAQEDCGAGGGRLPPGHRRRRRGVRPAGPHRPGHPPAAARCGRGAARRRGSGGAAGGHPAR